MLKIIFLDFDGVITIPETRYNISLEKVKLIEEIIKDTDAKIVISSTWRTGCKNREDFVNKLLVSWREITSGLEKDSIFVNAIYDVTDREGKDRGEEIQRWLDIHEDEVESYAILDDDCDMLDNQLFNFVQTDGFEGITKREAKLCKKILNNEKIDQPIRLNFVLLFKWYDRNSGRESNIDELLKEYRNKF